MRTTRQSTDDRLALRRTVRDLTALSALSAVWRRSEAPAIANSLADVLFRSVALDFVYVRVVGPEPDNAYETARTAVADIGDVAAKIAQSVDSFLELRNANVPLVIADPLGSGTVRLSIIPIGVEGECGFLAAGSRNAAFPTDIDTITFSVAANQAAVVLEHQRAEHALRTAITETEQRARDAEEARRVLQTILDNVPEGIILVGGPPDYPILANSRFGQELVGRPISSAVGVSSGSHAEHYGLWMRDGVTRPRADDLPLFRASRHGERVRNCEMQMERADGARIPILVDAEPIRDSDGRVIGAVSCWRDISRSNQLEHELRESGKRLSYALDAVADGVWDWNIQTGEVHYSRQWIESLGYSVDEVPPHICFWQSVVHPDDMSLAQSLLQAHFEGRTPVYVCENRLRKKSGEYRWNLDRGKVVERDSDGKPLRMVGTDTDITESKRAEETLRDSEQRLRLALAAGHMGTWEWEIASNRVAWSPALEAIHGLAPGAFPGTFEAFQSDMHPEDRDRVLHAVAQTLEHGVDHHVEYRIVWPDGAIHWVEGRGKLIRDASGRPTRMIGVCSDITERKRAQAAVEAAVRRLQVVTDTMLVPVTQCTRDFRYLWVSKAFGDWFGIAPELVAGRPIVDILGPDAFEQLRPYFERVLSGERVEYEKLVNYERLGPRWVHASYSPTLDDTGRPDGWVAVILDVTERKRLEEALKEADRRKDEFLATLAHELRNPLAPVVNALQILGMTAAAEPKLQWACGVINRQTQQMTRLIDDLLDVSRISRGKIELRREVVELATVVHGAIEISRPLIEENGHELHVALPQEPVFLHADLTRMAQVFSNLLNNAAKYTPPRGRIEFFADRAACHSPIPGPGESGAVVVTVRDNGIGIPVDKLPAIFEMFSQVQSKFDRAQGGLGIGLWLIKQLVEMHDGQIEAHSAGPGRGAEFVIRLPIAAPPSLRGARRGSDPAAAPSQLRVLIVDDNRDSAETLTALLRMLGNDVRTAYDGPEAMAAADEFQPDAVVLDIGLPKVSGYDVCRHIRQQTWGRNMFVVAVTGWGQLEDRRLAEEAGFDRHLVKPVNPESLLSLLSEAPRRTR